MSSASNLIRLYDIYSHDERHKNLPGALNYITCFCQVASATKRDPYNILACQYNWAKVGLGRWVRLSEVFKDLDAEYPWLTRRIQQASKQAPRMMREWLFIPINIEQNKNKNDMKKYLQKLALACWYVTMDYRSLSIFKPLDGKPILSKLIRHFRGMVYAHLPDEEKYLEWGYSGIINMVFRIFTEVENDNLLPALMFDDRAHQHVYEMVEKIINIWKSPACAAYQKAVGASKIKRPGKNMDHITWCQDKLMLVFRAYLYGKASDYISGQHMLQHEDRLDEIGELKVLTKKLKTNLEKWGRSIRRNFKNIDIDNKPTRLVSLLDQLIALDGDYRRTVSNLIMTSFQLDSHQDQKSLLLVTRKQIESDLSFLEQWSENFIFNEKSQDKKAINFSYAVEDLCFYLTQYKNTTSDFLSLQAQFQ